MLDRCQTCGGALALEGHCAACLLSSGSGETSEEKAERVFQSALSYDPGEREQFVSDACGDDDVLRFEVDMLMSGYAESGGDLGNVTIGADRSARDRWAVAPGEEPGMEIGHFRLIRQIGEGGMGVVWLAEQQKPVERKVALKVVKVGMDTRELITRFERERQSLALMNHPNIAQVFEAGSTPQGRPYLVMELVEGAPLQTYCKEHDLSLLQRIELFRDVCQAIAHAHQKGVIHRDLKPANILVGQDGIAKVIDFGVAKAMRDSGSGFTQHAQILGTPEYMSPEQAASEGEDVDTRTDVYSLGVVLYELLSGTLPLRRTEDPTEPVVKPSAAATEAGDRVDARAIRGDLDWITLKAMDPERERRYDGALALAEDLRRHVAGESVSAVPPTVGYRLSKFLRRNRAAVIATLSVIVALAVGLVISARQTMRAEEAVVKEREARAESARTLGSMFINYATEHGHAGQPDLAALWALEAARISREQPELHAAHLRRVKMWTEEAIVPIAAFPTRAETPVELSRLEFHPREEHLLLKHREGAWEVWDLRRESRLSFGGSKQFQAVAWSPDGQFMAVTKPQSDKVSLFRFPGGDPLAEVALKAASSESEVEVLAFNEGSDLLAVGRGEEVLVFKIEESQGLTPLFSIPLPDQVSGLAFSPTANDLLISYETNKAVGYRLDPTLKSYELKLKERFHQSVWMRFDAPVAPSFDEEGRTVTFRRLGELNRREFETDDRVDRQKNIDGLALAQTPDAKLVVCRSKKNSHRALVVEVATGRELSSFLFNRDVSSASFSGDSQSAVVAGEDGQVVLLEGPYWEVRGRVGPHQQRVMTVAYSKSGRLVATSQAGSLVRVWRVARARRQRLAEGHDSRVTLNSSEEFFALAGRSSQDATLQTAQVYRVSDGEAVGLPLRFRGTLCDAAFSPDGNTLATIWAKGGPGVWGHLVFWNWRTGSISGEPIEMPAGPRSLAWQPHGNSVAVLCHSGRVVLVDSETREKDKINLSGPRWEASEPLNNGEIAFDPSGERIVAWGMGPFVKLIDPSGDPQSRSISLQGQCYALTQLPGKVLACAESRTRAGEPELKFVHGQTGEFILKALPHSEWMRGGARNEDGSLLLTTSLDGTARIWDWRQGKLLCPVLQHESAVLGGAFVPGTTFVATGTRNGWFRVTDSRTGMEVYSFPLPRVTKTPPSIYEIEVTKNGRRALLTGDGIGGVYLVNLDSLHGSVTGSLETMAQRVELNAGMQVTASAGLEALTSEEWLRRWQAFRTGNPNVFPNPEKPK